LAEAAGISAMAVSKYERNQMVPSSDRLLKLAQVLGVRTEYFFRPAVVQVEGVEYRRRANLPIRARRIIEADVLDHAERMLELLALFPHPPVPGWALPEAFPGEISTPEDLEQAAERLREAWHLGQNPIGHLTRTLEDRGILVLRSDAVSDRRFDGLSCFAESLPILVVSAQATGDRQRLTLAHELGHLLLGDQAGSGADAERACFRFGAAFLAPAALVRQALGERRTRLEPRELEVLKRELGMSMVALLRRARDLEILDESAYRSMMRSFSRRGWRRREPGSRVPPEYPRLLHRLVYRALGESLIGESKAAELLGISLEEFQGQRSFRGFDAPADQ
jgi:Zn-dependent peptidase ImmA (M78 family)/DNA-binding XRE family transcriptional regulator